MPLFLITTALLTKFGAARSYVPTTTPFGSTTSTLAVFTPPLTPAATREPETSTVNGLPALAGSGVAVMPQTGRQGLTTTDVVPATPPEIAFTSYVPGVGAPVKVKRNWPFVSLSE